MQRKVWNSFIIPDKYKKITSRPLTQVECLFNYRLSIQRARPAYILNRKCSLIGTSNLLRNITQYRLDLGIQPIHESQSRHSLSPLNLSEAARQSTYKKTPSATSTWLLCARWAPCSNNSMRTRWIGCRVANLSGSGDPLLARQELRLLMLGLQLGRMCVWMGVRTLMHIFRPRKSSNLVDSTQRDEVKRSLRASSSSSCPLEKISAIFRDSMAASWSVWLMERWTGRLRRVECFSEGGSWLWKFYTLVWKLSI